MKALILHIVLIIGLSLLLSPPKSLAQSKQELNWISFETLSEKQLQEPRLVMIDVYADWCVYCKKMNLTTFKNNEVVSYLNQHFYVLKLNSESNKTIIFQGHEIKEAELASLFRVNSLPTMIFLNQNMEEVIPAPGFREAPDFMALLQAVKEKGFVK